MERERSVNIQEWMLGLKLRPSDLIAYALVWGFSQDGQGEFYGSLSYAAKWMGLTRQQTVAVFKRLTAKGLIVKKEYPGCTTHYQTAPEDWHLSRNLTGEVSRNLTGGCQESGHNNKEEYKDINKNPTAGVKRPYGEKVMMTEDEFGKLVDRFGGEDTARLCQILDDYLVNHPKKNYVSHYRAILSWCVDRLTEIKTTEQRYINATAVGQRNGSITNPGQRTTYADVQRKIREMEEKKWRR